MGAACALPNCSMNETATSNIYNNRAKTLQHTDFYRFCKNIKLTQHETFSQLKKVIALDLQEQTF
jgi:tRNA A37 threonylcarbamoyladenosine biosynthesis protein TsaE